MANAFPDKQSEAGFFYAAAADIVIPRPAGVLAPQIAPIDLIQCEISLRKADYGMSQHGTSAERRR
jgi:hypothetical protein